MPKFVKSSLVDSFRLSAIRNFKRDLGSRGKTPIRNGTGRVFRCQSYVPAQCHPALLCHGVNRKPVSVKEPLSGTSTCVPTLQNSTV